MRLYRSYGLRNSPRFFRTRLCGYSVFHSFHVAWIDGTISRVWPRSLPLIARPSTCVHNVRLAIKHHETVPKQHALDAKCEDLCADFSGIHDASAAEPSARHRDRSPLEHVVDDFVTIQQPGGIRALFALAHQTDHQLFITYVPLGLRRGLEFGFRDRRNVSRENHAQVVIERPCAAASAAMAANTAVTVAPKYLSLIRTPGAYSS